MTSGILHTVVANSLFIFFAYDIFLLQGQLRSKRLATLVSSLGQVNCNTLIDNGSVEIVFV
jgi:hypothetical protein